MLHQLGARTLIVGTYENPPLLFQNESGEIDGLFADFLNEVAHEAGWSLKYVPMKFSECLAALGRGEVDMVPAVAATYERRKQFDFTRSAVLENWAVVYRNRSIVLNNLFDLEGKRILALKDDVHLQALEEVLKRYRIQSTIIEAADYSEAMQSLDQGKADAAVVNRTFSTRKGAGYESISTLLMFNPQPLFFAFRKRANPDLIHRLDLALSAQKSDPQSTLNQSMSHWLKAEAQTKIPVWIYWVGGGLALLAILFGIFLRVLQNLVLHRTEELRAEKERSEQALRSQNLFLATLSHELRTPLNYLSGSMSILKEDFKEDPASKELLENCNLGISRLERLFTSLLNFAHLERGEMERTQEVIELNPLFDEVYDVACYMPRKPSVELKKNFKIETGFAVISDEDALFQISMNLLHNALKYTEKGSVEFLVKATSESDSTSGRHARICISVMDTGIGFGHGEKESILVPFQRGTKNNYVADGSGLGLSIVKCLVDLIDGDLRIESRPDGGSRFEVEFLTEQVDLT